MSNLYQTILASRDDMTDWLIHFTRSRGTTSALQILAQILAMGLLKPSRSIRSNKPTIYGPHPAVCFTEQPLGAFLEYVDARAGETFGPSPFGVLVHKHDAYADGALPVIYGLRSSHEIDLQHEDYVEGARQLGAECLPYREQYRFSAFAPTRKSHPLDWSHEREWRWSPEAGNGVARMFPLGGSGCASGMGMSSGICRAFVRLDSDIPKLQAALTRAIGRLKSANETDMKSEREDLDDYWEGRWRRALQKRVRIISLQTARSQIRGGNRRYNRLDRWPEADLHPILV